MADVCTGTSLADPGGRTQLPHPPPIPQTLNFSHDLFLNQFCIRIWLTPSLATTVVSSVTLHTHITQHSGVMYCGITDQQMPTNAQNK